MTDDNATWSVPETAVLETVGDYLDDDVDAALATVVRVEGNAYRRPGAKMVLTGDGAGVGAITAGCLEDEVAGIASEVIDAGRPRVERYDLMEDDDVWGLGVGCHGIIDVLVEPVDESLRPMVEAAQDGEVAALTVLSDDERLGQRAYVDPDAFDVAAESVFADLAEQLAGPAAELLTRARGEVVTVDTDDGPLAVFVDGIRAPPSLVVFGTGHDVGPVVELASKNDFRVTVIGFRGAAASPDRFPAAADVRSSSPANIRDGYDFDEDTYAVVMTHNFVDDQLTVAELLETPVPYVGLMGPRGRFDELLEAFDDEGRTIDDESLERVHTPIGLDLGGGSPYQIAHSIVAEVLAVANDRDPRHLSERAGPIHDRLSVGEE